MRVKEKDAKLYVVGPSGQANQIDNMEGDYFRECLKLVCENKVEKQVVFTGMLDENGIQYIFKRCKALLFFSLREGMPNAVLESLANNCVPITTEIDGVMAEILKDKQEGFILKENLKKIHIKEIDKIIESRKPYLLVKKNFSASSIARQYKELYRDLS